MNVEILKSNLSTTAHYGGGHTQGGDHQLRWRLFVQLYLEPEVEDRIFYPHHRSSRVVSFETDDEYVDDEMGEIRLTSAEYSEEKCSSTISLDEGQLIVDDPGLCTVSFKAVTQNRAGLYVDDYSPDQMPDPFCRDVMYRIEYSPVDGADRLSVSETLGPVEEGVGGDVLGLWKEEGSGG